jgi:hypothetical protein
VQAPDASTRSHRPCPVQITMSPSPEACVTGPVNGEPGVGDLVVVRAAGLVDTRGWSSEDRWSVITWGSPAIDYPDLMGLVHNDACAAARVHAFARGRRAWEGREGGFARLRTAPLVRKGVGSTYSINAEVTDATTPVALTRWQGYANLTRLDALRLLGEMGFSLEQSALLLSKASTEA